MLSLAPGRPTRRTPPLRLIVGLVPPVLIQPLCDFAVAAVGRRHRSAFRRLEPYAGRRVAVIPSDLPVAFEIVIDPTSPQVRVVGGAAACKCAEAEIRAPLAVLFDLLQGNIDGDALFFSRDLSISGDTELVVAMRNAVDDAEIDLAAALSDAVGPFGGPLTRAVRRAHALASRMLGSAS